MKEQGEDFRVRGSRLTWRSVGVCGFLREEQLFLQKKKITKHMPTGAAHCSSPLITALLEDRARPAARVCSIGSTQA